MLATSAQPQAKLAEVRVGKVAANLVCVAVTIVLCGGGVLIARLLPWRIPFADWHVAALVVGLVIQTVAHEALHALGLRVFAGIERPQIRFGVMWSALAPFCCCKVAISLKAYRRMALLPLLVIGTASLGAFLAFPSDCVAVFAGASVGGCVADVWTVAKLKAFEANLLVQDSPTEFGCDVFSKAPVATS